jgi:hypothetical protein
MGKRTATVVRFGLPTEIAYKIHSRKRLIQSVDFSRLALASKY